MIRPALIAGALLAMASPAEAHCHRIWHYPWRDPGCPPHAAAAPLAAQHERMVMPVAQRRTVSSPVDASPARQTIAEPGDGPPAWAIERLREGLNLQLRAELK